MPKVNFVKICPWTKLSFSSPNNDKICGLRFGTCALFPTLVAIHEKLLIYQRPESLPKTASGFLVEASSHFTEMTKLTCFCHIWVKWQNFHLMLYINEMTQCTRFVTCWSHVAIYPLSRIWLKCRDLRALSHFGWNVAIYAFSQAPKTILHPCFLGTWKAVWRAKITWIPA